MTASGPRSPLAQAILDLDIETARSIARCIGDIAEECSRDRIVTAWLDEKIDGDEALELLLDLDLIEAPHG